MSAKKKLKTPTIHTRGGQFATNTPSGVAAAAQLDEIEKEFPGVQTGRSFKHDLINNGGRLVREMGANYSIFQSEAIRISQQKSQAKAKAKANATKQLVELVSILGKDEVMNQLCDMEV